MSVTRAGATHSRAHQAAFSLGVLSAFFVHVVGQLYVTEGIFLALVWVAVPGISTMPSTLRLILAAALPFEAMLIVANVGSHAPFSATLPDYAAIAFTVIDVVCLWHVIKDVTLGSALLCGLIVGKFAAIAAQPVYFYSDAPWKFGLAVPFSLLAIVLIQRRSRIVQILVLSALSVFSIASDSRSYGLISAVLAIVVIISPNGFRPGQRARSGTVERAGTRRRASRGSIGLLSVLALGTAWLLSILYTYLVRAGTLGASGRVRLSTQGNGSAILMLLGGRSEFFFSLPAVFHNPFLGYGSVARLDAPTYMTGISEMQSFGLPVPSMGYLIPTHSYIMAGWVSAGVLGGAFWLIVLAVMIGAIRGLIRLPFAQSGAVLYLALLAVWNIVFSPFGASDRFQLAFTLVLTGRTLVESGAWGQVVPRTGARLVRIDPRRAELIAPRRVVELG